MKTLLLVSLILVSLPARAENLYTYSPAWGDRDLAVQAHRLDDAAQRLYQDLRFNSRRSDIASRGRDLARATHEFRHLADRRASYSQLSHTFRRVEQREEALARRLYDARGYDGYGRPVASLRQVHDAMHRVDYALQRYAFDGRDHRYRGSFVYVPRYDLRYDYGFGTRHDYRYDPRAPQPDNRRHDQRQDPRQGHGDDRRHDQRGDPRQDPQQSRRDVRPDDRQQDRQDERHEERRDERQSDPPARRNDDGNDPSRRRDPDIHVQEP